MLPRDTVGRNFNFYHVVVQRHRHNWASLTAYRPTRTIDFVSAEFVTNEATQEMLACHHCDPQPVKYYPGFGFVLYIHNQDGLPWLRVVNKVGPSSESVSNHSRFLSSLAACRAICIPILVPLITIDQRLNEGEHSNGIHHG